MPKSLSLADVNAANSDFKTVFTTATGTRFYGITHLPTGLQFQASAKTLETVQHVINSFGVTRNNQTTWKKWNLGNSPTSPKGTLVGF